ncbi:four-carbon acid sugar kinase family protein, partial [[Clostridium] symbiosum]
MKKKLDHILLGCVADDFTGASDAASFLAKQGIKTLLFNGIPKDTEVVRDCAAVVIALKTRSIAASGAVRDTLAALEWLRAHGAEQFYFKYCSTFDSTPEGNIGPVIDAALEKYEIPYTLLCPSLPVNRRIVKDGVLIVDGKPIAEGHMAHHPLNPIWASELAALMKPQGKYPCMIIGEELLSCSEEMIMEEVKKFSENNSHFYIIPDYTTDNQGQKIAEVFGKERLLTGGSGILEHLAAQYREEYECQGENILPTWTEGKGIALSGSCST